MAQTLRAFPGCRRRRTPKGTNTGALRATVSAQVLAGVDVLK